MILSNNTLYGTASVGGSSGFGTVFKLNSNGSGFTTLHNFSGGTDGGIPSGSLILSVNTLYGTAQRGGSSDNGAVFKLNTDGTGFTNLYSFTELLGGPFPGTNSDGASPRGVILSGNTLYGTTVQGGSSSYGTVFKLSVSNAPGSISINLYAGLSLSGSVGANYRIEYVYDPQDTNWLPFTNITLPTNPYLVIDTLTPRIPRRFYRVVLLP